jgi:predicted RNA-binding Zn ribbon-like protein
MIEPKTLIRWIHELVSFANGEPEDPSALFTEEDYDAADHAAHALTTVLPTPEHMAALREATRQRLAKLAAWHPSKTKTECPKDLLRAARDWLVDPFVTSTHAAFIFTPMDGVLSLTRSGELVVVPRFHSIDAQYAVTFAELIQADAPASVKKCATPGCSRFFVHVRGSRGQPPKHCLAHRNLSTPRVQKFRRGESE